MQASKRASCDHRCDPPPPDSPPIVCASHSQCDHCESAQCHFHFHCHHRHRFHLSHPRAWFTKKITVHCGQWSVGGARARQVVRAVAEMRSPLSSFGSFGFHVKMFVEFHSLGCEFDKFRCLQDCSTLHQHNNVFSWDASFVACASVFVSWCCLCFGANLQRLDNLCCPAPSRCQGAAAEGTPNSWFCGLWCCANKSQRMLSFGPRSREQPAVVVTCVCVCHPTLACCHHAFLGKQEEQEGQGATGTTKPWQQQCCRTDARSRRAGEAVRADIGASSATVPFPPSLCPLTKHALVVTQEDMALPVKVRPNMRSLPNDAKWDMILQQRARDKEADPSLIIAKLDSSVKSLQDLRVHVCWPLLAVAAAAVTSALP